MTPGTPPVLYISADTSDLTTRYKATPRMHMGADAWIPRDAVRVKPLEWHDGRAETPFGPLSITILPDSAMRGGLEYRAGDYVANAQADEEAEYRARIMSALAALPAPDEGEQEEGE